MRPIILATNSINEIDEYKLVPSALIPTWEFLRVTNHRRHKATNRPHHKITSHPSNPRNKATSLQVLRSKGTNQMGRLIRVTNPVQARDRPTNRHRLHNRHTPQLYNLREVSY